MPPYEVARPSTATGTGHLSVYRCITLDDQPLVQTPRDWTKSQGAFAPLSENLDPEHAALLQRANTPNVHKVWVELAYESARLEAAPECVSRLDALYCFADPVEAFDFQQHREDALAVWVGQVQQSAAWAVVDMAKFFLPNLARGDAAEFTAVWDVAYANALQYWAPKNSVEVAEILVSGPVLLDRRIHLAETLRSLGVLK